MLFLINENTIRRIQATEHFGHLSRMKNRNPGHCRCLIQNYLWSIFRYRRRTKAPHKPETKVLRRRREEQSLKLALGQPWVWSVSDFIFLASAYESGWPVLSLTISSLPLTVHHSRVGYGRRWSKKLEPNFGPGRDFNPEPLDWQSSRLTARPPHTPSLQIQSTNNTFFFT